MESARSVSSPADQNRLRSLFVPHGAPTFALHPGAAGAALSRIAQTLTLPRAIVVVSAHWETSIPTVGLAERPRTIHDFSGFPEALYAMQYPATGCPEAAEQVVHALEQAGLPVARDSERGLDHGAWVPLRLMFPDAQVPVVPLSIQPELGPKWHYRVGQALAHLPEDFLIIASGNLTHNLRDYRIAVAQGGKVPDYVSVFSQWFGEQIARHQHEALVDYRAQAPHALQAHPTEEHLLPLFVALGAGGKQAKAQRVHHGVDDYVLAMDAWTFAGASHA